MDDTTSAPQIKYTALGVPILPPVPDPPASWHRSQKLPSARKERARPLIKLPDGLGRKKKPPTVEPVEKQRTLDAIATGLLRPMPLAMVAISAGGISVRDVCAMAGSEKNRSQAYTRRLMRELCRLGCIAGIPEEILSRSVVYPTPKGIRLALAAIEVVENGYCCDADTAFGKLEAQK